MTSEEFAAEQHVAGYPLLRPTQANLAKLRPAIPPGYQRSTRHPGQRVTR